MNHALLSTKPMTSHLTRGVLLVRLETGSFQGTGEMARLWMEILTGLLISILQRGRGMLPYNVLILQKRGLDLCLFRVILFLIMFLLYQ